MQIAHRKELSLTAPYRVEIVGAQGTRQLYGVFLGYKYEHCKQFIELQTQDGVQLLQTEQVKSIQQTREIPKAWVDAGDLVD